MKAIEKTFAKRRFDEIILSTLPPGISAGSRGTCHIASGAELTFY
jgi:hypothetical protein